MESVALRRLACHRYFGSNGGIQRFRYRHTTDFTKPILPRCGIRQPELVTTNVGSPVASHLGTDVFTHPYPSQVSEDQGQYSDNDKQSDDEDDADSTAEEFEHGNLLFFIRVNHVGPVLFPEQRIASCDDEWEKVKIFCLHLKGTCPTTLRF